MAILSGRVESNGDAKGGVCAVQMRSHGIFEHTGCRHGDVVGHARE